MSNVAQKIIVIAGPTATGKTSLAVTIAKEYSGEVISADSRQVYRGLDIGSAKVTKEEMQGVSHHLLDVADPTDVFTVSDFVKQGITAITTVIDNEHLPIICGGTGFYIDSLIYDNELPKVPANKILRKQLEKHSSAELHDMLNEKDARRAQEIDANNKVRIIRALEIYNGLGYIPEITNTYTSHFDILYICLERDTDSHALDIEKRIRERISQGMLEEVSHLHEQGISWERLESFGLEYRYLAQHLQGKCSLEEAVATLLKETKKFVKRQYTWFRKNKNVIWFDPTTQENEIITAVNEFISK